MTDDGSDDSDDSQHPDLEEGTDRVQTINKGGTERVDTLALNGLRGIASLHIMLFHYCSRAYDISLGGGLLMPLFFVISGYIHGIAEGL